MATYIYCFKNETKNRDLGKIGIDNTEVTFIPYRDIAAAVSNAGIFRLDSLTKEKLLVYAACHQRVNEALLKEDDVVPMTFGMIAQDTEEVLRMLEKCYFQLKATLKNIAGKTEFVVQASWDRPLVVNEIFSAHPDLQELKKKAVTGGIGGIRAKLKLGKLLYEKAELQRKAYTEHISSLLEDVSHDSKFNKLIDEQMLINLSCLIDKAKEPELDKRMTELGAEFNGKLRFRYIGPMPPYSFTNINFSTSNFELIDEARRALGLGEQATFENIKRSYYACAQKYHPDKRRGSQETAGAMKKIIQAYRTLKLYCQSCDALNGPSGGEKTPYSFRKKDMESAILVQNA